jgi:hypothetical protein
MAKNSRGLTLRPLWIITSYQNNRINTLTIDSDGNNGGDDFLPVFSFEEEAEAFLHCFETDEERGWRRRETAPGELVSILMGPCARVRWVALDPLPLGTWWFAEALPLVSLTRERFVRALLGERGVPAKSRACLVHEQGTFSVKDECS